MADDERSIPRAYIYAFEQLGFLVTKQNAHLFSEEDRAAWDEAVAEGERRFGPVEPGECDQEHGP